MCGFVGILRPDGLHHLDAEQIRRATNMLIHRGPDAHDVWVGPDLAMGATRLAIRGGQSAAQPLCLGGGGDLEPAAVIAFNGEIYGVENAAGLKLHTYLGPSDGDTSWLAAHLDNHGIERLDEIDGMFAFAHWQPRRRRLLLARDRWGEKPLYLVRLPGNGLAFASEPVALLPIVGVDWTVDPYRIIGFMRHSYWTGPGTPWPAIERLGAGEVVEWIDGVVKVSQWCRPDAWTFAKVHTQSEPSVLRRLLTDAVLSRLVGERPIGALLSGGIDSSLVVALAAEAGVRLPVWTVRWAEPDWDEREYAASVSAHFKLDQHWVDFGPSDVPRLLDELVDAYGEPFGDESLMPTCAVLEAAASEVTVVLTGEGGDELFGGYNRYVWGTSSHEEYMDNFCSCPWSVLHEVLSTELLQGYASPALPIVGQDIRDQRRWIDLHSYLPDDLLRKMDRAAGRVGVENRVPFLARNLSSWAATLSAEVLWRGDVGKQPLRSLAAELMPDVIARRGKLGFGVPLIPWFKGPLQSWLRDRLLSGTLAKTGWFQSAGLERVIREHVDGRDRSRTLFNLLVLAVWLERWPRRLRNYLCTAK